VLREDTAAVTALLPLVRTPRDKHGEAGTAGGIGGDIGWHMFRHSYRLWLDETGAPITVQKELTRDDSIQTTIDI